MSSGYYYGILAGKIREEFIHKYSSADIVNYIDDTKNIYYRPSDQEEVLPSYKVSIEIKSSRDSENIILEYNFEITIDRDEGVFEHLYIPVNDIGVDKIPFLVSWKKYKYI